MLSGCHFGSVTPGVLAGTWQPHLLHCFCLSAKLPDLGTKVGVKGKMREWSIISGSQLEQGAASALVTVLLKAFFYTVRKCLQKAGGIIACVIVCSVAARAPSDVFDPWAAAKTIIASVLGFPICLQELRPRAQTLRRARISCCPLLIETCETCPAANVCLSDLPIAELLA